MENHTMDEKIDEEQQIRELIEELRVVIKDTFVATVRKFLNGIKMEFPDGKRFFIGVWKIRDKGQENA